MRPVTYSKIVILLLFFSGINFLLAAEGKPIKSKLQENVDVRLIRIPLLVEPDNQEDSEKCINFSAEQFLVKEENKPCKIEAIEHQRIDTDHFIIIDNSDSMNGYHSAASGKRIDAAKTAAKDYLLNIVRSYRQSFIDRGEVPPRQRIAIASFNETLSLRLPFTDSQQTDKMVETIEQLQPVRKYTNIWWSLFSAVSYLHQSEQRKVVVLITDGGEQEQQNEQLRDFVLDYAFSAKNLIIIPINVRGPETQGYAFKDLADYSGGTVMYSDNFDSQAILQLLMAEHYLSYYSRTDKPGQSIKRKVRLKKEANLPCKITYTGAKKYYRQTESELPQIEAVNSELEYDSCIERTLAEPPAGKILAKYSLPSYDCFKDDFAGLKSYAYALNSSKIIGCTVDFAYERASYLDPKYNYYPFVFALPPLSYLKDRLKTPEDLLFELLLCGVDFSKAWKKEGTVSDRSPYLLDGTMFLGFRNYLVDVIYQTAIDTNAQPYNEYLKFLEKKLKDKKHLQAEETIESLSSGMSEKEKDELSQIIFKRVKEELANPELKEKQQYLSSWLGDISLVDLVRNRQSMITLEGKMIETILSLSDLGLTEQWLARFNRGWQGLPISWTPRLGSAALVGLLPVFEQLSQVVGFYRFLPETFSNKTPAAAHYRQAFALNLVAMLLRKGLLPTRRFSVAKKDGLSLVSYQKYKKENGDSFGKKKWGKYKVSVKLASPEEDLVVNGYFNNFKTLSKPNCITLNGSGQYFDNLLKRIDTFQQQQEKELICH